MNRRNFIKTTAAGIVGPMVMREQKRPKTSNRRMVVFAADGLRYDTAYQLWVNHQGGIGQLNGPICALSGGALSVTQPEWASVWSGMPCWLHRSFTNLEFEGMPDNYHIAWKLMQENFYAVWLTGKGWPIKGDILDSPHYQVYDAIKNKGYPGVYIGDEERENDEVYDHAVTELAQAATHDKFICFIHFRDPDHAGHEYENYASYLQAAGMVNAYIGALMAMLPGDTDIIVCSDHGFNFRELGAIEDGHKYAPKGMMAANFEMHDVRGISRQTIGRVVYSRMGGDPDNAFSGGRVYSMYGVNL